MSCNNALRIDKKGELNVNFMSTIVHEDFHTISVVVKVAMSLKDTFLILNVQGISNVNGGFQ